MKYEVNCLEQLTESFETLPGIGRKSAQRMAFYMIEQDKAVVEKFCSNLMKAKNSIRKCKVCEIITDQEICSICKNESRDKTTLCVVEDTKDVMAFERTGEYTGYYHVLNGLISPMDGVGVEELSIKEMLTRLASEEVKEVIMATNPTLEGEATAMYITKLLQPFQLKITRLAYGIPVGGNLEYADEVTLLKALEGRNEII